MKRLALIFISIFALNILGEVQSGHCDEAPAEDSHYAVDHSQIEAHHSDESGQDCGTHSDCAHLCHFGHCGHVVLQSAANEFIVSPPLNHWNPGSQSPHWRDLSPLLRPPIA